MGPGSVALVPVKAVLRIFPGQFDHQAVTAHLREDGCGRDGGASCVAVDDAAAGHLDLLIPVSVDEGKLRFEAKPGDGPVHGQHGGAENVTLFDLFHRSKGHTPCQGKPLDFREQLFPLFLRELLGVVQARQFRLRRQNHRRRADRSREGAASGLIHTADQPDALRVKFPFHFPEIQLFHLPPRFPSSFLIYHLTFNISQSFGASSVSLPNFPPWYSVSRVFAIRSRSASPPEMRKPLFRAARSSSSQGAAEGSGSSL